MADTTLTELYKKLEWSEEELRQHNILLLLLSQLSTLQGNIAKEIEDLYNKKGIYTMALKHNHKKIKDLIKNNAAPEFFRRMNMEQAEDYAEDSEKLERIVYQWAGLEMMSQEGLKADGLNLNHTAKMAKACAVKRGKVSERTTFMQRVGAIQDEVWELRNSTERYSKHIFYTEQQEEAADVIIATLSFLADEAVDINQLITDKMKYNEKRND